MNDEQKPQIPGLRYSSGYTYEKVIEALDGGSVKFHVTRKPHSTDTCFRSSSIIVDNMRDARTVLGKPDAKSHHHREAVVYHGTYALLKDFDRTALDGHLHMQKGNLIEEIVVHGPTHKDHVHTPYPSREHDVRAGL